MITIFLIGMVLAGCAGKPPVDTSSRSNDPQKVIGKTWQWVSTITPVEKITVPKPARYTIHLAADGKLTAQFDCNRGGGSYTIAEGKLSFGPMMSTRMACPPDSLDSRFIKDLQRVSVFFLMNGSLYLELPYDSGTMQFKLAP